VDDHGSIQRVRATIINHTGSPSPVGVPADIADRIIKRGQEAKTVNDAKSSATEYFSGLSQQKRLSLTQALKLLRLHMDESGPATRYWQARIESSGERSAGETENLGSCDDDKRTIYLTRWAVRNRTPLQIRDTILHEIAHAVVDEYGHGKRWQQKALELGVRKRAIRETLLAYGIIEEQTAK